MVGWHSSVKALRLGEASSGPCPDTIESVESVPQKIMQAPLLPCFEKFLEHRPQGTVSNLFGGTGICLLGHVKTGGSWRNFLQGRKRGGLPSKAPFPYSIRCVPGMRLFNYRLVPH